MTRTTKWLTALSLPVLLLPAIAWDGSPAQADDPVAAVTLEETERGCRVTVYASNSSRGDIWLRSEDSRVRAKVWTPAGRKWMSWKKPLPMSNRRIRPRENVSQTMELDLGCKTPREYEFLFKRGHDTNIKRVSETTRVHLGLGDAAKFFRR